MPGHGQRFRSLASETDSSFLVVPIINIIDIITTTIEPDNVLTRDHKHLLTVFPWEPFSILTTVFIYLPTGQRVAQGPLVIICQYTLSIQKNGGMEVTMAYTYNRQLSTSTTTHENEWIVAKHHPTPLLNTRTTLAFNPAVTLEIGKKHAISMACNRCVRQRSPGLLHLCYHCDPRQH
jgi:hypothetical protein